MIITLRVCGAGAACRDGNNATIDASACLAKLMSEYRRLELVRDCRVPCPSDADETTTGCPSASQSASPAPVRPSECPRNCIGTRAARGMSSLPSRPFSVPLIPFHFARQQTRAGIAAPRRIARASGSRSSSRTGPAACSTTTCAAAAADDSTGVASASSPPPANWPRFSKSRGRRS